MNQQNSDVPIEAGRSSVASPAGKHSQSPERTSNDEGADPISDIRKQNPGEKTSADLADELDPNDPHKVEKLTKAGRPDFDPNAGSD